MNSKRKLKQDQAASENKRVDVTPLVKSLSGIVDSKIAENARESYTDYLNKKYL